MELRRHNHPTAGDNSDPVLRPSTPAVCHRSPAVRQHRDLLAGLAQHPVPDKKFRQPLQPLSRHSAAIYSRLFPESPCPEPHGSLTLYERLTIALTVAQLTETGALSDFYAEWLSPLPGPTGTRENNLRLTTITEYTRLLTCSSAATPSPQRAGLQQSGLTLADIVTLHQLCGFVGWQAQWISGVMTLAADGVTSHYSNPPLPPYPDLLTGGIREPLARLKVSGPVTARRHLLRDIRTLGQPSLNAEIIGQAPAAARAWLILRALSGPTADAGHLFTESTAMPPDFRRRTSPLSCRELEALKRQDRKADDLLSLLGRIAMNIWDYRLIQLAVV